MAKKVRDLLKIKQKEVFSISPKATVYEALSIMGEKEIGALMVLEENGKIAGIITERDYARKVVLRGRTAQDTRRRRSRPPWTRCSPSDGYHSGRLHGPHHRQAHPAHPRLRG